MQHAKLKNLLLASDLTVTHILYDAYIAYFHIFLREDRGFALGGCVLGSAKSPTSCINGTRRGSNGFGSEMCSILPER